MSGLHERDFEVYTGLADALLPAFGAMPSAGSIATADAVDTIIGLRPDLAADLRRAIDRARLLPPVAALDLLEQEDNEALAALRIVVLGGYYLDPKVMAAIGYEGQKSQPLDDGEPLDFVVDGMLEPVKQRGPIWRDPSICGDHPNGGDAT
jgi:hypothetical protein